MLPPSPLRVLRRTRRLAPRSLGEVGCSFALANSAASAFAKATADLNFIQTRRSLGEVGRNSRSPDLGSTSPIWVWFLGALRENFFCLLLIDPLFSKAAHEHELLSGEKSAKSGPESMAPSCDTGPLRLESRPGKSGLPSLFLSI